MIYNRNIQPQSNHFRRTCTVKHLHFPHVNMIAQQSDSRQESRKLNHGSPYFPLNNFYLAYLCNLKCILLNWIWTFCWILSLPKPRRVCRSQLRIPSCSSPPTRWRRFAIIYAQTHRIYFRVKTRKYDFCLSFSGLLVLQNNVVSKAKKFKDENSQQTVFRNNFFSSNKNMNKPDWKIT